MPPSHLQTEYWWAKPLRQTGQMKFALELTELELSSSDQLGVRRDWLSFFLLVLQILGAVVFEKADFRSLSDHFQTWAQDQIELECDRVHDNGLKKEVRAHAHTLACWCFVT